MMVLKLQPVFFDKIWGGKKLKEKYNYPVSNNCGECWGISAHKNGSSIIMNTEFAGKTLKDIYNTNRELFGNYPKKEFPILVKVIDAEDNLSIQVHPDNEYAKKENSLGKEECWYVLDTDPDTEIIVGHNAKSKQEFEQAIKNGTLEHLCKSFKTKPGDFFYIETGTLHAICKGTTLLEVQQSSDITYRVYDYNRLQDGQPRDLHVKEALDVVSIPDKTLLTTHKNTFFNYDLVQNTTLSSYRSSKHGDYIFIIEGEGSFNKTPVRKGDFLMVSANSDYSVFGNIYFQKTTF